MGTTANAVTAHAEAGLSLGQLLVLMRQRWRLLTCLTLLGGALLLAVAIWMPPVYRAEVVVSPVDDSATRGSFMQFAGQLGALASIAGLPIGGASSGRSEAIATLRSRILAEDFITRHGVLRILFATDWDAERKAWRAGKAHTPGEGVDTFLEDVLTVADDKRTGLVTVSVEWHDRQLAAAWANALVADANGRIRNGTIGDAEKTLAYLNVELQKTAIVGVQQGIYRLMENQVNTIALAKVREDFAFRVIDPAVPPEPDDFVRPQRLLLTLLGLVLGLAGGVLVVLLTGNRLAVADGT